MKTDSLLLIVAMVAAFVSLAAAGFTYYSIESYKNTWFTGFATSTGTANLTVESTADINFTNGFLNWSSGRVNQGAANATLDTALGTVTNGNWTAVTNGFQIENIGNVNVTLDLLAGKDANSFLGGTAPLYRYNVTNNETGSCLNQSAFNFGQYYDVNTTSPGTRICTNFLFNDSKDRIRVDLRIIIPSDSLTGVLGDTWTATGTAA